MRETNRIGADLFGLAAAAALTVGAGLAGVGRIDGLVFHDRDLPHAPPVRRSVAPDAVKRRARQKAARRARRITRQAAKARGRA